MFVNEFYDIFAMDLEIHFNLTTIPKVKHQTLICVHGYVIDSGMPEGWVKLKLEGVEFGDGEKETAHNIRLSESAVTLFLQSVKTFLCFFVSFHKSIVAVDILILVMACTAFSFIHFWIRPATTSIS